MPATRLMTATAALLFANGWAHPVAVLAGYSALPVIILAHGLRLARESRPWR